MYKCCIPTVDVNSITVGATSISLNVLPFEGCINCSGKFNLRIPFNFSNLDAGKSLNIVDAVATYPVETCNGNNLRVWQLIAKKKCGTKYLHCKVLNDPNHVQVLDCLPQGVNNSVDPLLDGISRYYDQAAEAAPVAAAAAKAGK